MGFIALPRRACTAACAWLEEEGTPRGGHAHIFLAPAHITKHLTCVALTIEGT